MPGDTLTLRMRAYGGRQTRRELDKTGRSARGLGASLKAMVPGLGMLSKGFTLLATRMAGVAAIAGVLTLTLGGPTVAAVALLTAALATLGGVITGVFLVGAATVLRFKQTMNSAGSEAWELKKAFDGIKTAFAKATALGADKVLHALRYSLERLTPLIEKLTPAFTDLAMYVAAAIETIADAVGALGPKMDQMLRAAGPLLMSMANGVGPLLNAIMSLGIAGIPVLQKLVDWLTRFFVWLGPAIDSAAAWERDTHTLWNTLQTFGGIVAGLGQFIYDLGQIIYGVYQESEPFWTFLGGAALTAVYALKDGVAAVSDDMEKWAPIIVSVGAALMAGYTVLRLWMILQQIIRFVRIAILMFQMWRAGVAAATLMQIAFNTALLANPIGLVIAAIAALVVGVIVAYKKVEWFRNAVNWVWEALKTVFNWVKEHWPLLAAILAGPIGLAIYGIVKNFDAIKAAFVTALNWIIDRLNDVIGLINKVIGAFNKLPGPDIGQIGAIGHVQGLATGGTVTRGGAFEVGERGKETVYLPAGAAVQPAGGGGGDVYVHATLVTPTGEVLGRQVLRAARRKASLS